MAWDKIRDHYQGANAPFLCVEFQVCAFIQPFVCKSYSVCQPAMSLDGRAVGQQIQVVLLQKFLHYN